MKFSAECRLFSWALFLVVVRKMRIETAMMMIIIILIPLNFFDVIF